MSNEQAQKDLKTDAVKLKILSLVSGFFRPLINKLIPADIINICFGYYYFYSVALADFQLKRTLGAGNFCAVRLTNLIHHKISTNYAIKTISKKQLIDLRRQQHTKNEFEILLSLNHPFIVKLFASFQDKLNIYFVIEYIKGGDFYKYLREKTKINYSECLFYSSQIVLILQYLHNKNIIYRDLKPENILIRYDGYLCLTDFGLAKTLNNKSDKTWTLCGTPEYMAPELLLNRGYSFFVDWWSFGILIFEMLSGLVPFNDDNPMKIYSKILSGRIKFPLDNKKHIVPKKGRIFIKKLLTKNIKKRLGYKNGATDIMNDDFFDTVNWENVLNKSIKDVPYKPVGSETKDNALDQAMTSTDVSDVPTNVSGDDKDCFEYLNLDMVYF